MGREYSAEEVRKLIWEYEGGCQMRTTANIVGANQDRACLLDSNRELGKSCVSKRR